MSRSCWSGPSDSLQAQSEGGRSSSGVAGDVPGEVPANGCGASDDERSAHLVGELGGVAGGGRTLDLECGADQVAGGEGVWVTGLVGAIGRGIAIKGELEWSADGGDTADDVGAVNGGGVPGVDGAVDSFDGDLGIARALCDGDGDGFVEEPEEPFDDDGFMVSSEGWLAGQVEGCAHGFEVAEEGGASVGGNEEAEADAKEDLFHECGGECGRVEGDDFRDDGEASEVAHGGEEILGAVVCRDGAGLPDVDVDDGKGRGDGPGVDQFAVLAGGRVREDAVLTRALPGRYVKAEPVPVEPKAYAMEGLEVAKVASGGR
eukprot:scaffold7139_cov100-Amphora_coffeaeformis.AAC.5